MENAQKIAYSEVNQILNILGDKYKKQIPIKIIEMIDKEKDNNYRVIIDNINDINLSRKALIILSMFNLKYWEKNEKKIAKLKKQYYDNEMQYQNKINHYKQKDWLKKKNNNIIQENYEEISLVNTKRLSIILKIKDFLKKIIHKRK